MGFLLKLYLQKAMEIAWYDDNEMSEEKTNDDNCNDEATESKKEIEWNVANEKTKKSETLNINAVKQSNIFLFLLLFS